jgi:hypothetical protein
MRIDPKRAGRTDISLWIESSRKELLEAKTRVTHIFAPRDPAGDVAHRPEYESRRPTDRKRV